jgi:hypothetical protein
VHATHSACCFHWCIPWVLCTIQHSENAYQHTSWRRYSLQHTLVLYRSVLYLSVPKEVNAHAHNVYTATSIAYEWPSTKCILPVIPRVVCHSSARSLFSFFQLQVPSVFFFF